MSLFSHCSCISVSTIILELFIHSSEFHYFYAVHVFNVHDHHMYTVRPDTPSMVGETSYGTQVGFIKLDEVLTIFFN